MNLTFRILHRYILLLAIALIPIQMYAESITLYSTSIRLEKRTRSSWILAGYINTKFNSGFKSLNRWGSGFEVGYPMTKWLTGTLFGGFSNTYHNPTTNFESGISRDSYYTHSVFGSIWLQETVGLGNVTFRFRERAQYSHRFSRQVDSYYEDGMPALPHVVESKNTWAFRTRIKADYEGWKTIIPNMDIEVFDFWSPKRVQITSAADWYIKQDLILRMFYRFTDFVNQSSSTKDRHTIGIVLRIKL